MREEETHEAFFPYGFFFETHRYDHDDIRKWCVENFGLTELSGRWCVRTYPYGLPIYCFRDEVDAIAFKLRWT
jgi:hypothetical protein